jgi:hypothetical protein
MLNYRILIKNNLFASNCSETKVYKKKTSIPEITCEKSGEQITGFVAPEVCRSLDSNQKLLGLQSNTLSTELLRPTMLSKQKPNEPNKKLIKNK